MADTTSEFIDEVYEALGIRCDTLSKDARNDLYRALDNWRDAVRGEGYDEGYDEGESDAETKPEFENVDCTTLNNLETGLDLLKNGDTLSAPVYLDRALRDFGSSYY